VGFLYTECPIDPSAKSIVAEHSTESGYQIKFQETKVLAKTSGYTDHLVKEATEIRLHLNNVSREEGFDLPKHGIPAPDYQGTPLHINHYFLLKAGSTRKQNFAIQFSCICRFAEAFQISSSVMRYEARIFQIWIFLP
jgi:hypothetical protein